MTVRARPLHSTILAAAFAALLAAFALPARTQEEGPSAEERRRIVRELPREEKERLRAALERRPLVKSGRTFTFNQVVFVGGVVDRAVVVTPPAPEPGR